MRYREHLKFKKPYVSYMGARGSIDPILSTFDIRTHYYRKKKFYKLY